MDKQQFIEILAEPSGYARLKLSMKLHPKQAAILDTLFSKRKTKVSALFGNELGKTSICGVASILYALEMRNAFVVSTSGTFRQIVKQLIPAMRQYSSLFPANWEFLESSIKINGETRYIGFQTQDPGRWQGWHGTLDRPLYIFTDESAALDDNVFESIARCNPDYLLCAGSPLNPEGVFYSINNEPNMIKQFHHFRMSKFEALKSDGWWIDKQDLENMIEMWGKDNPLILSSVYAEFATNIQGGVITLADLEKSYRNPVIPDSSYGNHIGIDLAAGGGETVIAARIGNEVSIVKAWRERDTMSQARQIVNELELLKQKYNIKPSDVSADADGLGLPIIQRIKELGWVINEFHGNATAKDTGCKNLITDCWINACRKIRNGTISIPNDQELKLQLTSRKSFMNSSGKLQLESKEDMKARGVPSPDRADAVAMSISEPTSGILSSIRVPTSANLPTARRYAIF